MRRSLLLRFLGLSLAVALGAVIATAVLATYSTSEQLQGGLDGTANQLQEDGEIYAQLAGYASEHKDWSEVDRLVRALADKTGRRVALTRTDGSIIVDSARVLGAGPDLPSVPAATIDSRVAADEAVFRTVSAPKAAASAKTVSGGSMLQSPFWGLTDVERRDRERLAEKAVSCFRAQGVKASIVPTPEGVFQLVIQSEAQIGNDRVETYTKALPADARGCAPTALYAPSARSLAVNVEEIRRATSCLDGTGQRYKLTDDPDGLRAVVPADGSAPEDAFAECVTTAHSQAIDPYVAPTARLFLGGEDQFNVFSGDGLLRTAATALGVLLIAAVVTVLAGRRLVRPILALTGAARRMTTGDHAARVPVSGRDEVARLGHAFNAMAASIQQHDFQRKAMVSDVAHELRTPLANIKGYLVASQDGVVPLDRALVASLLEEADLLEHLVVDLQDLALADAGMLRLHPSPRDLTELVQQVVAAHRPAAERAGVTLAAEGPGQAVATVDGARIRQALGNLVSNAIRFTPSAGQVAVAVRRVEGGYDLTVTDTGTGIAAEHLPLLFDRFYRVEGSRSRTTGGSGLGLAITKHLVDAHHGSITVTSTPGEGSTFTIHLPAGPS